MNQSITKCPNCEWLKRELSYPAGRVLIVPHSDGFIQTYSTRAIDIHISIMPSVFHRENEIMAEQLFERQLPERFRAIYNPHCLRSSEMVRTITASDLSKREIETQILAALDTLNRDVEAATNHQGGRKVWTA